MKRIIGLLILTLFAGNIFAQDISQRNVPAVILNAFQLKYSNATNVTWELEQGNYHVSFEVNYKDNELVMNYKGNILKHQQDLYISEIPKAVLETIKSKVAFFDVKDADRFEEGSEISYRVKFEISGKSHEFWIDNKGELLKYIKELKDSEVPVQVLNAAKAAYNGYEIRNANLTEESGKVIYNLEMRKSKVKVQLLFNPDGKILEVKNK